MQFQMGFLFNLSAVFAAILLIILLTAILKFNAFLSIF